MIADALYGAPPVMPLPLVWVLLIPFVYWVGFAWSESTDLPLPSGGKRTAGHHVKFGCSLALIVLPLGLFWVYCAVWAFRLLSGGV